MVGVDVSASSIKLVALSRTRGGDCAVAHAAIEPLQPGWVVDGVVDRFDEVASALRRAVQRSGSRARQAALALPASAVITRRVVLPAGLSALELEQQVEIEAEQYIPFAREEVSLDFCPVGAPDPMTGSQEVLIAAARRERVDDCAGLAEAAGLKAVAVEVRPHATQRAARRLIDRLPVEPTTTAASGGRVVALFEVGAATTRLQVLRGGELLYARDQSFGGEQLTERLMRQYGFSRDEAETTKCEGALPADAGQTVLPGFNHDGAQEVARALYFFFSSTPFNRVDQILLAGGSASVPGLAEAVAESTAFTCRRLDPFEGMALGPGVREARLRQQAPAYLAACGLALHQGGR
ncbi:MAG: type IV pilus assembly protein PilM [Comamonas sp.]